MNITIDNKISIINKLLAVYKQYNRHRLLSLELFQLKNYYSGKSIEELKEIKSKIINK